MLLVNYVEEIILKKCKTEIDKAIYLCYFFEIDNSNLEHSIDDVVSYFEKAGFHKPNKARLLKNIKANKNFVKTKNTFKLHAKIIKTLNEELSDIIGVTKLLPTNEIIEASKFNKHTTLQSMVLEMNVAYSYGVYNGCEVLMRRVFENLLIIAYEKNNIADQIKKDGLYIELAQIVKNAESNITLNLSRSKLDYSEMVKIFNTSAHNRYYMATKKTIESIKHKYAVAVTELLYKSKLLEEIKDE